MAVGVIRAHEPFGEAGKPEPVHLTGKQKLVPKLISQAAHDPVAQNTAVGHMGLHHLARRSPPGRFGPQLQPSRQVFQPEAPPVQHIRPGAKPGRWLHLFPGGVGAVPGPVQRVQRRVFPLKPRFERVTGVAAVTQHVASVIVHRFQMRFVPDIDGDHRRFIREVAGRLLDKRRHERRKLRFVHTKSRPAAAGQVGRSPVSHPLPVGRAVQILLISLIGPVGGPLGHRVDDHLKAVFPGECHQLVQL